MATTQQIPINLQEKGGQQQQQQEQQPQVYAPSSLGLRTSQLARTKASDTLDNRVWPFVQQKIQDFAARGNFTMSLTSDDVQDSELKSCFDDRGLLNLLMLKLKREDFDAHLIQRNNKPGIYVSWAEEEETESDSEAEEQYYYDEYEEGQQMAQSPAQFEQMQGQQLPQQQQLQGQQQMQQQQQYTGNITPGIPQEKQGEPPLYTIRKEQQSIAQSQVAQQGHFPTAQQLSQQIQQVTQQTGQGRGRGGFARGGFPGRGARGGFGRGGRGRGGARMGPTGLQGPGGRFAGLGPGQIAPAPETMPSNLTEVFQNIPCLSMVVENWARKRLVLCGNRRPLDKALQRMNRHQITSVPVIDEDTRAIMGILDIIDVVTYMSTVASQHMSQGQAFSAGRWDFALRNAGDLIDLHKHKNIVCPTTASMFEVIEQLCSGHHRIMIVDKQVPIHEQQQEETEVVGLISQSDVIRWMSRNRAWLLKNEKIKMTIRDLKLSGSEKVLTVDENMPAYMAFSKMAENNVYGAAVVNNQGKLVENLSASNIRGISRVNFQVLGIPTCLFLARDRRRGWWTLPLYITPDDTLENVLLMFAAANMHRLYIVDEEHKPVDVITLTDVIRQVVDLSSSSNKNIPIQQQEKLQSTLPQQQQQQQAQQQLKV